MGVVAGERSCSVRNAPVPAGRYEESGHYQGVALGYDLGLGGQGIPEL